MLCFTYSLFSAIVFYIVWIVLFQVKQRLKTYVNCFSNKINKITKIAKEEEKKEKKRIFLHIYIYIQKLSANTHVPFIVFCRGLACVYI